MKKYLPLILGAAIALTGTAASAQSMVKVGTVDMKKIFESYYKTKDAETRINEARNARRRSSTTAWKATRRAWPKWANSTTRSTTRPSAKSRRNPRARRATRE